MIVTTTSSATGSRPQFAHVSFDDRGPLLRLWHSFRRGLRLLSCSVSGGRLLSLLLVGGALALPVHAQSSGPPTGVLTVRVDGLDSNEGTVRVELTTEENYDREGNVRAATLPIRQQQAQWTVTGVPHGTYAVRLYHDEDDDGELDTNLFGVPQEAFGFSNDARGRMGPPDFEAAAFTLEGDSLSMTITAK
jgi:uncharacterized protein (DUF2141 family)